MIGLETTSDDLLLQFSTLDVPTLNLPTLGAICLLSVLFGRRRVLHTIFMMDSVHMLPDSFHVGKLLSCCETVVKMDTVARLFPCCGLNSIEDVISEEEFSTNAVKDISAPVHCN